MLAADAESFKRDWIRLAQDDVLYEQLREAGIKRALSHPLNDSVNEFERFAAEAVWRHEARSSIGRNRTTLSKQRACAQPTAFVNE